MDIPPDQIGEGLDQAAIGDQRLEQRRPHTDGRVMERMPALVQQFLQVAEPALRVRREDPRRGRQPDAVVANPTEVARAFAKAVGIVGRPGRGATSYAMPWKDPVRATACAGVRR